MWRLIVKPVGEYFVCFIDLRSLAYIDIMEKKFSSILFYICIIKKWRTRRKSMSDKMGTNINFGKTWNREGDEKIHTLGRQDQRFIYSLLSVSSECTLSNNGIIDWKLMLHNSKKKWKHFSRRKLLMSMTDYFIFELMQSLYRFEALLLLDIWVFAVTWFHDFFYKKRAQSSETHWFILLIFT